MARPARPAGEGEAVRAAADAIESRHSCAAVAGIIAKRVVREVVAYADADPSDTLALAMLDLKLLTDPTPIDMLARSAAIDTAGEFLNRRAALFRARGCKQLSGPAWDAETRAIAAEIEARLAKRYARHLAIK